MNGPSQGRGCAVAAASTLTLNVDSPREASVTEIRARRPGGTPSIFDDCPLCGQPPVEPVRFEGQMSCRGCTGSCSACGSACVPGDELCHECGLHLHLPEAVPA